MNKDNIVEILKAYNIPYALTGKNVSKGYIGLNCPFCGDDDNFHLGINPEKNFFACWRNNEHRGNIVKLFMEVLGFTEKEVKLLLSSYDFSVDFSDKICYNKEKVVGKKEIIMPENFHKISYSDIATRPFYHYLINRGFSDIDKMVDMYDIRCCISGEWQNRIIFPIYNNNQLVTWVGRSIESNPYLRYMDLAKEESVQYAKHCLYNLDNLKGGKILFICEGIFDALKIDFYTPKSIQATCIFTTSMRTEQISLLAQINQLYDKVIVLLDTGVEYQSITLSDKLSFMPNVLLKLFMFKGKKDAGELTQEEVMDYISKEFAW